MSALRALIRPAMLNSTTDVENRLGVPALGALQKIEGFAKKGFVSEAAFFYDSQSTFASSVIYVVKAGSTPYQVAQNGLKKLLQVNAPVLGVVLNQLDLGKAEKKGGHMKTYGSTTS